MNQKTEMNPEVKKLWVDALRSGEYKQGTSTLIRHLEESVEYCCLGVLTELYNKLFPGKLSYEKQDNGNTKVSAGIENFNTSTPITSEAYLIKPVIQWAGLGSDWVGLGSDNPIVEYNGCKISLAVLNDDNKLTFDEIADCIDNSL
jgi:hypothetical protein